MPPIDDRTLTSEEGVKLDAAVEALAKANIQVNGELKRKLTAAVADANYLRILKTHLVAVGDADQEEVEATTMLITQVENRMKERKEKHFSGALYKSKALTPWLRERIDWHLKKTNTRGASAVRGAKPNEEGALSGLTVGDVSSTLNKESEDTDVIILTEAEERREKLQEYFDQHPLIVQTVTNGDDSKLDDPGTQMFILMKINESITKRLKEATLKAGRTESSTLANGFMFPEFELEEDQVRVVGQKAMKYEEAVEIGLLPNEQCRKLLGQPLVEFGRVKLMYSEVSGSGGALGKSRFTHIQKPGADGRAVAAVRRLILYVNFPLHTDSQEFKNWFVTKSSSWQQLAGADAAIKHRYNTMIAEHGEERITGPRESVINMLKRRVWPTNRASDEYKILAEFASFYILGLGMCEDLTLGQLLGLSYTDFQTATLLAPEVLEQERGRSIVTEAMRTASRNEDLDWPDVTGENHYKVNKKRVKVTAKKESDQSPAPESAGGFSYPQSFRGGRGRGNRLAAWTAEQAQRGRGALSAVPSGYGSNAGMSVGSQAFTNNSPILPFQPNGGAPGQGAGGVLPLGEPVYFPRSCQPGENPPIVQGGGFFVGDLCGKCLRRGHKARGCALPSPFPYQNASPIQLLRDLAHGATPWQQERQQQQQQAYHQA